MREKNLSKRIFPLCAYDAHGAGGRYPELKKIVESTAAPENIRATDIRSALRSYLQKHYPVQPGASRKK